eukprot:jgi/Galph1/835/GphlegSOOS_G5555.1
MLSGLFKEVLSPSGVTHSSIGYFVSKSRFSEPCLAVVKGTCLDLYIVHRKCRTLELISTFPLYGRPEAMDTISQDACETDFLLLVFEGGSRWSVIKWEYQSFCWITVQLIDLYSHLYCSLFRQQSEPQNTSLEKTSKTSLLGGCSVAKEQPATFRQNVVLEVDSKHRIVAVLMRDKNVLLVATFDLKLRKKATTNNIQKEDNVLSYPKVLDLRNFGFNRVQDFCFMFGYYLPTFAILDEKTPTWSGRFAVLRDTRSVYVMQLEVNDWKMKKIWQVESLSHECFAVYGLSYLNKGGVVLVGWNILLYFRDGVFIDGICCNDLGELYRNRWPLQSSELPVSLDGCEFFHQSTCLDPQPRNPLIILRDGEVFELSVPRKGSESRISLSLRGNLMQPSCFTYCGSNLFFVGSHVSNSVLVKVVWKTNENTVIEDEIDVEIFGKAYNGNTTKTFQVESILVEDSIQSIGTIRDLEAYDLNRDNKKLELVAGVGSRDYGAVVLLRTALNPQILTKFDLEGCQQLWSLTCKKTLEDGFLHFLLLSTQQKTVILSFSNDFVEVLDSQFSRDTKTLNVAKILDDRFIVQVFREGFRVLENWNRFTTLYEIPPGDTVTYSYVCDPYIMLHLSSGYLVVLKVFMEQKAGFGMGNKVLFEQVFSTAHLNISSSCIFQISSDINPLLSKDTPNHREQLKNIEDAMSDVSDEIEDYEKLYLTSYSTKDLESRHEIESNHDNHTDAPESTLPSKFRRHFIALTYNEGSLEIFDLFSKKCCFSSRTLSSLPKVLGDDREKRNPSRYKLGGSSLHVNKSIQVALYEFPLQNTTGQEERVTCLWMFVQRSNQVVAVYRGHCFVTVTENEREQEPWVSFYFVRQNLFVLDEEASENMPQSLKAFRNVSGHCGVFIGGRKCSLIVCSNGYSYKHEVSIADFTSPQEKVICIADIEGAVDERKIWILDNVGTVRLGELRQTQVDSLSFQWPIEKFPMNGCVSHVVYHPTTGTFGVVVSYLVTMSRSQRRRQIRERQKRDERAILGSQAPPEEEEEEANESGMDDSPNTLPMKGEMYEMRIYRADTWELVDKYIFKDEEAVLSATFMVVDTYRITDEDESSGNHKNIRDPGQQEDIAISKSSHSVKARPKECIVVGTGFIKGEDAGTRGRLMLFEIARQEAYTEESGAFSAIQLMLIAEKELKSVVSSTAHLEGYICCGVGPRVEVYKLVNERELVCCSFYSGYQLFSCSLNTVKQYVFVGDMYKGSYFLFWRDRNKSLNFLGKDFDPVQTLCTEFLIQNDILYSVNTDTCGNLHLLEYTGPQEVESRGGEKLLRRGVMHLGTRSSSLLRIRTDMARNIKDGPAGSHSVILGTWDGSLSCLIPLGEKEFQETQNLIRRIYLNKNLSYLAGLNPEEFRVARGILRRTRPIGDRLVDATLLTQLCYLDYNGIVEIARANGTDAISLLRKIQNSTQNIL